MDKRTSKILMFSCLVILGVASILGIWRLFAPRGPRAASDFSGSRSENSRSQDRQVLEKEEIPAKIDEKSGGVTPTVPADLVDAGEFAENIYDAAKAGDWTMADAKFVELGNSIEKLQIKKIDTQGLRAIMPELKSAISAREKRAVLLDSNMMTFKAAEMSGKYETAVPVQVVKLDFYGRELEIWSGAQDLPKLRETARAIRKNWDEVKPKVTRKNGAEVSLVFENLVKRGESAKTIEDYARLATPILDEVDNLEKVFE